MDWTAPGNTYNPAARNADNTTEANGDLDASNPTHAGIYYLRDFITTGDAIRIKLPFTDPVDEFPEYLWIENHNGIEMNSSPFDQWQYQGYDDCIIPIVPGLMMYIQIDKDIRQSNYPNDVYGGYANYTRPLTADGFYDRDYEYIPYFNECIAWGNTYAFEKALENPLTGGCDQEAYTIDVNDDEIIKHTDQRENYVEKFNDEYYKHLYQLGHSRHVFTLNGNKKVGISTNPPSASMMNLVGYNFPASGQKNLRKVYLNGVSVEILSQETNGDIKVQIQFDNVDIENDVRWCADEIVLSHIESPSGYSLNVISSFEITLDQGTTATRMDNPIVFQGKKIFASPTLMRVTDQAIINMESGSDFVVKNGSKLQLETGSRLQLEEGSVVDVKEGSYLYVDDCASLLFNGSSTLIVRSGASLYISPEALVYFENGTQNFTLEPGAILETGSVDPNDLVFPSSPISGNVIVEDKICYIPDIIYINNGGDLTLRNTTLRFDQLTGKIVIHEGGKLTIESSCLSGACQNIWQGIEVEGNPSLEQIPTSNQGMITIMNEGTIKNAMTGITAFEGAIVIGDSANFENNMIAVDFKPYGFENISYFTFCEFETNEEINEELNPDNFVVLTETNGITFNGCSFKNTWGEDFRPSISHGSGIYARGSGLYLDYQCKNQTVPCDDYQYCLFEGLQRGVNAANMGADLPLRVRHTEFKNNIKGFYLTGYQGGIEVTSNDFDLFDNELDIDSYGLYLDYCSGYLIEDNSFYNSTVVSNIPGLYVNNSGTEDNMIYNNSFNNIYYAIVTHNINRNDEEMGGLCIKCNDFTDNVYDISTTVSDPIPSPDHGIAEYQGSMDPFDDAPAGNIFSDHGAHEWDIYNEGNNIEYIHHLETSTPLKVKPEENKISINVLTKENKYADYDKAISCPSTLNYGGGDPEGMKSQMASADPAVKVQACFCSSTCRRQY